MGGPPTGYLDTNIVSGIRKEDLGTEQDALRQILHAHKRGVLRLVTSSVTQEEMQMLPSGVREAHEDIYALLFDVPNVAEESLFVPPITNRGGSRLMGPVVVTEADLGELRAILPDENDARHLFQSIRNGVDYFITADRKTILSRAAKIEAHFPISVRSPSQLVAELGL